MKEFICIIWDDFILFNKSIGQLTNCGWDTPIEQFISDIGLIIPMGLKTLSAFSLSGRMLSNPVVENDIIKYTDVENVREYGFGMTILPSGKVISICIKSLEPFQFLTNIIPTGSGLRYGISFDSGSSDALYGFVRNSQSINECFAKFCEMNPLMYQDHYRIFKISELVLWINECLKCKAMLPFDGFEIKPSTKATDVINILEPKEIKEWSIDGIISIIDDVKDNGHHVIIENIKKNDYLTIGFGDVPNFIAGECFNDAVDHLLKFNLNRMKLKYAEIPHRKLGGIPLDFITGILYNMFIVDDMLEILSLKDVKINDIVIVKCGSSFDYYQNISNYNTALNDWELITDIKKFINISYSPLQTNHFLGVMDESEILNLEGVEKGDLVKVPNIDDRHRCYINHTGKNQSMNDWMSLYVTNDPCQYFQKGIVDFDYEGI